MRAIRVHPGEYDQPVIVRGAAELAELVASTQVLGLAVQRHAARVVGYEATGIDDYALGVGLFPVLAPPGDVVARGVNLRDVRLAPAENAAVPRQGAGRGRGCLSLRRHRRQAQSCQRRSGGLFQKGATGAGAHRHQGSAGV